MRLLKCADCNQDISITSDKCPNCGSKKQFKNYVFMRKELAKAGITPMEMMNFQRRGGKIRVINFDWLKRHKKKILIICLLVFVVQFFHDKLEHKEIVTFEGREYNVNLKAKELIKQLDNIKPNEYEKLRSIYKSLRGEADLFKKRYEMYDTIIDKKSNRKYECQKIAWSKDESILTFPTTYSQNAIGTGGDWADDTTYVFVNSFTAQNAFGVELNFLREHICTFDENFNLVNIKSKSIKI